MNQNLELKNIDGEIWKDIEGYEDDFQISNMGRVKSLPREIIRRNGKPQVVPARIKKQRLNPQYYYVSLTKVGEKHKMASVHRLVAKAFIPNPEEL